MKSEQLDITVKHGKFNQAPYLEHACYCGVSHTADIKRILFEWQLYITERDCYLEPYEQLTGIHVSV